MWSSVDGSRVSPAAGAAGIATDESDSDDDVYFSWHTSHKRRDGSRARSHKNRNKEAKIKPKIPHISEGLVMRKRNVAKLK